MRIAFDITTIRVAEGGISRYNLNLLRALVGLDRDNEYLLLDYLPVRSSHAPPPELAGPGGANVRVVRCHGIRHRRLARWKAMQRPGLQALASFVDHTLLRPWAALAQASMRKELGRALEGVDVFHASGVLPFRNPSGLTVATVYDMATLLLPDLHSPGERELQQRKHRFVRDQADLIIAISHAAKRDIVEHLGISPSRVGVVYGGVGPEFRPIDDRQLVAESILSYGLAPGNYLLTVGTLEPRKNLVRLIGAYDDLRRTAPRPLPKLVLAGAAGWRSEEVAECADSLGIAEDVLILGRVPQAVLPALYNGAAAFVYPSLYEGFGLPPLEAMACGVPVVASDTSAIPEVVGDAGVLVDPTDTRAIAEALAAILADSERSARLRALGLERARRFTWERAARQLLAIYGSAGA